MEYKDYYKTLEVDRKASADEIKRAYRKLARKYHPDRNSEAGAEDKFKNLQEAYEVLKDPEARKAYDQLGANWKAGQQFRPPPGWDSHAHFSPGDDLGGFSDFFRNLFGGAAGGFSEGGFGGSPRGGFGQGPVPQSAMLKIPLEDAYHGATRTLSIDGNKQLRVKIPAGVTEGQQIRLPRQANGADLYLKIQFEPHRWFRCEGRDVQLELPIAPWEAALGSKVKVPTLGGAIELTVPKGTASGRTLRLRGRGLPGATAGDQLVTLKIVNPPADDRAAQKLFQQMADTLKFNPRQAFER